MSDRDFDDRDSAASDIIDPATLNIVAQRILDLNLGEGTTALVLQAIYHYDDDYDHVGVADDAYDSGYRAGFEAGRSLSESESKEPIATSQKEPK